MVLQSAASEAHAKLSNLRVKAIAIKIKLSLS